MPTQAKIDRVNVLKEKLERCSIAVTTNFSNIRVNEMTELRRRTRTAGFEFLIIKNTLMSLAADAAQRPQFKDIMQGPTAVAFGYDDPIDVAKTLHEYIRTTRSALTIQGAVMGDGPALQTREVERLATLPPRDQLLAQLLGQLNAPVHRLLNVLNGPLWSLGGLLQARIQQMETEETPSSPSAEASAGGPSAQVETDESPAQANVDGPSAQVEIDESPAEANVDEPADEANSGEQSDRANSGE